MSFFRKAPTPTKETPKPIGTARTAIRLKVMRPEKFSDAPLIADELMAGRTVVMNLEMMERDALRHLLDFISGVTYALDGSMKKIAGDATFIVTPHSVSLADVEEAEEAVRESAPETATAEPTEAPPKALDPLAAMFSAEGDDD